MSEQSDDNSRNYGDHAGETPRPPGSSDLVAAGPARHEPADDPHPDAPSPREITLRRLTPPSSWNGVFGDAKSLNDRSLNNKPLSDKSLNDKSSAGKHFNEEFFADGPVDGNVFGEAVREPAGPAPQPARRALSVVAMIAIAALAGAASGAAVTFGIARFAKNDQVAATAGQGRSIDEAVAKVNADVAALKANVENASKTNSARLAKLGETLDKLKPSDTTGSVAPPLPASVPSPAPSAAAPATQFARLPVVDGWVLREVADGGALVEGRAGTYEVFAGDPLPGVGRVDAIRRQDGRWVVVTSRGLIVAR